jgi:uncharacterized protein (DUF2141 family)
MPGLACALTLGLSAVAPVQASARDLFVLVSGIESARGEISCALYNESKGFPQDDDGVVDTVRLPAAEGLLTCIFRDVEPGRYAVSVVHDENGNQKLDTNFMGFAKEPWGVTNNVRPDRRSPKFNEAVIYVSEEQLANHEVKIGR